MRVPVRVGVRMREAGAPRAREPRNLWAQGALDARALETGRGPSPGCRAWGRHGAREALPAAAVNSPGRGNPRGLREALGELGAGFGEADLGASPGGIGRAGKGVRAPVPGCLPQDLGAKRVLSDLPAALPASAAGWLSPGAARILSGGTWLSAPRAAQRSGREDRAGRRRGRLPRGERRGERGRVTLPLSQSWLLPAAVVQSTPAASPVPPCPTTWP